MSVQTKIKRSENIFFIAHTQKTQKDFCPSEFFSGDRVLFQTSFCDSVKMWCASVAGASGASLSRDEPILFLQGKSLQYGSHWSLHAIPLTKTSFVVSLCHLRPFCCFILCLSFLFCEIEDVLPCILKCVTQDEMIVSQS